MPNSILQISTINFSELANTSGAWPPFGSFIVGIDSVDSKLKKMDSYGNTDVISQTPSDSLLGFAFLDVYLDHTNFYQNLVKNTKYTINIAEMPGTQTVVLPATGDSSNGDIIIINRITTSPNELVIVDINEAVVHTLYSEGDSVLFHFGGGNWTIVGINNSNIPTYTASNGLTMLNNNVKLGGALTETETIITGTNNNSLRIGSYTLNENLASIGIHAEAIFSSQRTSNPEFGTNNLNLTPGGFYTSNNLFSNTRTIIETTPFASRLNFYDSKIIEIIIYGGIGQGSGESFTIEGVTFTEGIDFVGQGDSVLDVNYLLSNIPWNTIPNFESVEGDFEYSPTIILKFNQNVTSSHTFSNGFINKNLHGREVLLSESGVLLKSNKNELTVTDSTTLINSDNVHIVKDYLSGKSYTGHFNESSIELTHYDINDKKSQLSIGLSDRSSLSRFNNKIVSLAVTANILPGENFTINGITFTEGIDFTVVDDPIIDAETISNIDYSSVPNLYEVKYTPLTQVITYLFYYPATLTNNMVNCYPINNVYVNEVSVSDGFAMLRSNDSSIMLTETGHTFRDDNPIKYGLRYFDDYSANFTDRSLVDKAFVNNTFNNLSLAGTYYTYANANGTDVENAQELQNAYNAAKLKYIVINETISIPQSFPFSVSSGQLYVSAEMTQLPVLVVGQQYNIILDDVQYNAIVNSSGLTSLNLTNITAPDGSYNTLSILVTTIKKSKVIVSPGYFNFSSNFVIDEEYVDVVSLDGNRSIIFNGTGTVNITANNVFVKGFDVVNKNFTIATNLNKLVVENCKGGEYSFGGQSVNISGTFTDCEGGDNSFGYFGTTSGIFTNCKGGNSSFGSNGTALGIFTNCKGGDNSFGYFGTASGTFTNCKGGNSSFGSNGTASGIFTDCEGGQYSFCYLGTASGIFTNCIGLYSSFGSNGTASGIFTDCKGGEYSFGNNGTASGTFNNCIGDTSSFGGFGIASGIFTNCVGSPFAFGGNGTASGVFNNCISNFNSFGGGSSGILSGKLYYCRLIDGEFQTVSGSGRTYYCIDGNGDTNNQ